MLARSMHGATRAGVRSFAKKAAPAKTKVAVAAPADKKEFELKVVGLNILKNGSDPVILPDSEYPDWVFELHKPLWPSSGELTKRYKEDPESLSFAEERIMVRKWNRLRIKDRNSGD